MNPSLENVSAETSTKLTCYHCKQPCDGEIQAEGKAFCCEGCKTVFEILSENNLCDYYSLSENAGIRSPLDGQDSFAYLNEPSIRKEIIEFDSPSFARIRFLVPNIHCISCIWLLENLHKIEPGVLRCEVNFSNRKVCIDFKPQSITLGKIAGRMALLGYPPLINLNSRNVDQSTPAKSLVIKLAIAGFVFGNVMLLSFPEYLGLDDSDKALRELFSYLNLLLAVPVMVYCASDYFKNAWKSFSQKQINIDVPIAAGLLALFSRSAWEIVTHAGPGYLDSLTGLVFFLLIGRWFQGKTYETLAFDRDYKSYFPLAVQRHSGSDWLPVIIYDLKIGDVIKVRNHEIVPADSTLLTDNAQIDYSFVTGESKPAHVVAGSLIYAGGRLIGAPVELQVDKITSQGHLTSIWNNPIFQKPDEAGFRKTIDLAARRFTWTVLILALLTAAVWYVYDPSRLWLVLTSVLMVACPCALALAAPFTYGSFLRFFGRHKLYLKNSDVIERLGLVDAVVFDKTGTVTYGNNSEVTFKGIMTEEEFDWVKSLTLYSTHPLSNLISKSISGERSSVIKAFREFPGLGIEGVVEGHLIKIGSASFVNTEQSKVNDQTTAFVSVDGAIAGYFSIQSAVRKNIKQMFDSLGGRYVALISGDNEADQANMNSLFPSGTQLVFNQSPADKLQFIKDLQHQGKKVMMVGDGLNDAGALKQSDVGIAVTDDTAVFTPACDGILQGDAMEFLDRFLTLAQSASTVLRVGFGISFVYNAVALTVAMTGHLTPMVAAILMPISSISVVGFSTLAARQVVSGKLKWRETKSS